MKGGTPAGTYTLTVTATMGGTNQSVPLTLIVQKSSAWEKVLPFCEQPCCRQLCHWVKAKKLQTDLNKPGLPVERPGTERQLW